MLVACHTCHHQFDVGDLEPGSKVLCHCGVYVRVPEQRARDAVVAHCSSCGAHLEADAKGCGYCGSEVSAVDHQLGEICPECYARLLKGAQFCSGCGVGIHPEALHGNTVTGLDCPRCSKELRRRQVKGGSFNECSGCGGIWLAQEFFERVVDERDEGAVVAAVAREQRIDSSGGFTEVDTVRYVPCPVCQEFMNRKNFGEQSGVVIDWCKGHGYWFDAFELERIMDFIATGGLDAARRRKIDRQKREIARRDYGRAQHPTSSTSPVMMVPLSDDRGDYGSSGVEFLDTVFGFIERLFRR